MSSLRKWKKEMEVDLKDKYKRLYMQPPSIFAVPPNLWKDAQKLLKTKEYYWEEVESFTVKNGLIDPNIIIVDDKAVIALLQRLVDLEKFLKRLGIDV